MQNSQTKQNVTRRMFAGLMGLPAVAVAANAAVTSAQSGVPAAAGQASKWMPDVLRQSELQSVFDDLRTIELRILNYRRRVIAGAVIEPGPRTADFEIDGPEPGEPELGEWGEFGAADFTICPVERAHARRAVHAS